MRRVLPTCFLAACLAAATAGAQDTTIKTKTKIDHADDAKTMTLSGCLAGGQTGFTLSSTLADSHGVPHERSSAVGTSGAIASYELSPRDGVDLNGHVGERVELMGMMIPAATKHDDDAKFQVKEETKVKTDHAPDQKSETKTKVEVARGAFPKFAVVSVRTVSPTCS